METMEAANPNLKFTNTNVNKHSANYVSELVLSCFHDNCAEKDATS